MGRFKLSKKQKKNLYRVIIAFVIVATLMCIEHLTDIDMPWFVSLPLYLAAYLIVGYDVLKKAVKGIVKGQVFDENFLIISIRGGFKAFKVTVSASGTAVWDKETSTVKVDIKSVDIPVISVDPSTVNAYIQPAINDFIHNLMRGYEIRSFEVRDDYAIVEAMKR